MIRWLWWPQQICPTWMRLRGPAAANTLAGPIQGPPTAVPAAASVRKNRRRVGRLVRVWECEVVSMNGLQNGVGLHPIVVKEAPLVQAQRRRRHILTRPDRRAY